MAPAPTVLAIRDALLSKKIIRKDLTAVYENLVRGDVNKLENLLVSVASENLA